MKKVISLTMITLIFMLLGGLSQAEWLTFNGASSNEPPVCQLVSSNSDSIVLDFFLSSLEIEPWTYDPTYSHLTIPDMPSSQTNSEFVWVDYPTGPAGFPELPQVKMMLAIPKCSQLELAVATDFNNTSFVPDYLVNPIFDYQPGMTSQFCLNDSIYQTGDFYPAALVTYTLDQWRDLSLAILNFTPVRFMPPYLSGQPVLGIWTQFRVTIKFVGVTTDNEIADLGYFGGAGNAIIANYNKPYSPPSTCGGSWDWTQGLPDLCDYLIIVGNQVSATAADSAKIEELATHRSNNLNGFHVRIIRTGNIPNSTSWLGIRDYITNVYNANTSVISSDGHLVYVLLLGDAWEDDGPGPPIIVPTTPIIPRTEAVPSEDFSFGSDHYYANIDPSGGYYFEDVALGRLTVGNSAELAIAVDKIIRYETIPCAPELRGWKKNVAMQAGPALDYSEAQGQWVWNQTLELSQQNFFYQLANLFELWATPTGPYQTFYAEAYHFGPGPTVQVDDRFHTDYDVYAPEDSCYTRANWLYPNFNGQYTGQTINDKGIGLYLYNGHGTAGGLAFQMYPPNRPYFPGPWPIYGIQGTPDSIQNADQLALHFFATCTTGDFDFDDTTGEYSLGYLGNDVMHDNFTEHLTVKDDRGAIAAIGAVGLTWSSTSNLQLYFCRYLTGELTGNAEPYMEGAIGSYLMLAKMIAGSIASSHYMLFGDPALNYLIEPTSGNITSNTTWNGRVDVISSIMVEAGATLTIEPGTDIILHNGAWLEVNGKLMAQGTYENPIRFRGGTYPGYGIVLALETNPQSTIVDCEFERLDYGLKIEGANLGSVIFNNDFADCPYGIYAENTAIKFQYNTFTNCGIGIYAENYNGTAFNNAKISFNTFTDCDSVAVIIMAGQFIYVEGDTFNLSAGSTSIWCFDCTMLRLNGNLIDGGDVGIYLENCDYPMMLDNEITNTNWSAVDLFNSSPYMGRNVFQEGDGQGLRLFDGSVPIMSPYDFEPLDVNQDPYYYFEPWGYNTITDHASTEIWTDGQLPNIFIGRNNIYDTQEPLPPTIPHILCTLAALPPNYVESVANNYWGPNVSDTLEARQRISPTVNLPGIFTVWVEAIDTVLNVLTPIQQPVPGEPILNQLLPGDHNQKYHYTLERLDNVLTEQQDVLANLSDSPMALKDSCYAVIKAGQVYLGCAASLNKALAELPASALRPRSVGSHLATSQYLLNLMSGISSEPPFVQATLLPEKFALYQNYPNPFNPATAIRFDLPQTSRVKLEIYNIRGQRVESLIDKVMNAGSHSFLWQTSQNFASGIYFCRFAAKSMQTSEQFTNVRRLLLLK